MKKISLKVNMLDKIEKEVYNLLCNDNSGHDFEHIKRVLNLSLKFAEKESADKYIVSLIALLHDVDDYKLFGLECSENLDNAKRIMKAANIGVDIQGKVLSELRCIGYSKRLKGIKPKTLEGQIVSDADMCDALGVTGILRTYKYSLKKNNPFFDKNIFPLEDITSDKYINESSYIGVCRIFEKILRLKDYMLTNSGKEESVNRHKIVVDFLYNLFIEEDAQEWIEYLKKHR